MECWICKIDCKDPADWRKHAASFLHKENAKTHCVYTHFKEPSPEPLKEGEPVFKVPAPKKSPAMAPRKSSAGSDFQLGDQRMASPRRSPLPKDRPVSPVSPLAVICGRLAGTFCGRTTLRRWKWQSSRQDWGQTRGRRQRVRLSWRRAPTSSCTTKGQNDARIGSR